MRTFTVLSLFVLLIAACAEDKPKQKALVITEEQRDRLTSGMSVECLKQEHASDIKLLEKAIEADQKRLAQMGVLATIQPTMGPLGQTKRIVADHRAAKHAYPKPTVDILAQLGMTIENQYDGLYGVTDEAIRGLADAAHVKLGIVDADLRGYTLSFRQAEFGAMTKIDHDRKLAIVMIAAGEVARSGQHELAHVLTAKVAGNKEVVSLAKEMIAIAGEGDAVDKILREEWTYERQNLPILGMGRTVNGESGMIHANNTPLDGWRYDLLRLTDEKIGEDGQVALAKRVYDVAAKQGSMTMDDLRPIFEGAGLGDLALLKDDIDPGLYLDLAFANDGTPVVLAKTIDNDGYEGLSSTSFQAIWRDDKGQMMSAGPPHPLTASVVLADAAMFAPHTAALEVRVGGQPYVFTWGDTEGVSNATTGGTDRLPKADSLSK